MKRAILIVLAACGSPKDRAPAPIAPPAPVPVPIESSTTPRRWIPGDLHVHLAPFDVREGQTLTIADLDATGPAAGLEWVIVTPHVHPSTWGDRIQRTAWLAKWSVMAREARAATHLTIIPGTEFTNFTFGHFGVSGVDLATVGDDFLASAVERGGFVVVNHPFALPSHIPGIPITEHDLSFRPWSTGHGEIPHLDGVEVWNMPLALGDILSRARVTSEDRAFVAADALARRDRRPIAIVGGSDTHGVTLQATTWVLAPDASERAVFAALRAGATCVGSPDAGDLAARGDDDPRDRWAAIGEAVHAHARVELRFTGTARVFVDGADRGEHDGGFIDDAAAGLHTYRITRGASRCGFVYANR